MDNPTACFLFSLIFKPKASCTSQKLPQSHQALQVLILTRFWTLVSKWTKWNGSSLMVCQKGTHKWKLIPCKAKDDLVLPSLSPSDSLLATAKDSAPHQHNPCLLHSKAVAEMELAGKEFQSHKVATPVPHWDDKYDFSPSGHYQRMTQIHTQSKTKQEPWLYLIISLLGDQCVLQLSARLLSAQKSSNRKTRSQLLITIRWTWLSVYER